MFPFLGSVMPIVYAVYNYVCEIMVIRFTIEIDHKDKKNGSTIPFNLHINPSVSFIEAYQYSSAPDIPCTNL